MGDHLRLRRGPARARAAAPPHGRPPAAGAARRRDLPARRRARGARGGRGALPRRGTRGRRGGRGARGGRDRGRCRGGRGAGGLRAPLPRWLAHLPRRRRRRGRGGLPGLRRAEAHARPPLRGDAGGGQGGRLLRLPRPLRRRARPGPHPIFLYDTIYYIIMITPSSICYNITYYIITPYIYIYIYIII